MNQDKKQNKNLSNNISHEDEHDDGEWSDNCLYRRMLRGSQRIRMMQKRQQQQQRDSNNNDDSNSKGILQQALQDAEVEPSLLKNGIKVLRINILKSKTFDMRYFTIDNTREFICVTPEPLPPNLLQQGNCRRYFSQQSKKKQSSMKQQGNNNNNNEYYQFIDVADIDAWHVGTVATRRAEVARRLEITRSQGGSTFDQVATEKLLTIYYKGSSETLDLVVPVAQQLAMIVSSLSEIHSTFHRAQPWISKESLLLRYIKNQMEMESDLSMTQVEFHKICELLQVGKQQDPAFCFQSRTSKNALPFSECLPMLRSFKPKKNQASILWDFMFSSNKCITHKDLHRQFLSQIQSETHLTIRQAHAIWTFIQTMEVVSNGHGNPHGNPQEDEDDTSTTSWSSPLKRNFNRTTATALHIIKEQFEEFLYSDLNDAYDPQIQQMEQQQQRRRMDQPLSAYWINTCSFKTYRMRENSKWCASVQGYMKALIRGAKCIDLDCWDGSTMPNTKICIPMVGNSAAACSSSSSDGNDRSLPFRHVCDVVEAYLKMHPQSYPIILSIENYCTPPFQEAMAVLLQEILGHRLVVVVNNNDKESTSAVLPSPDALRGKVLLHAKAHPEVSTPHGNFHGVLDKLLFGMIQGDDVHSGDHALEETVGSLAQLVFLEGGQLLSLSSDNYLDGDSPREEKHTTTTTPITTNHHHHHRMLFMAAAAGSQPKEMLQTNGGMKGHDLRKYHASHLTRTHISSSSIVGGSRTPGATNNPNPIQAWSLGCQVVALRLDAAPPAAEKNAMILNDGLFRQQNGVGYVLKPPSILGHEPASANQISLFVRILGGRCLPSPKNGNNRQWDLSVEVTLYDIQTRKNHESTEEEKVYMDVHHTTSVDGSGFAPVWKDRGKKFAVQQPDVAMVLFQVMASAAVGKSEKVLPPPCVVVASAAIPVSCLRKGYRSIQFFDDNNCRTGALRYASLLVHIEY